MHRYAVRRAVAVLAVMVPAACSSAGSSDGSSSGGSHPVGATRAGPAAAWPTYHGNNHRSGLSPDGPLRTPLRRAWARRLDGAVYAQPIVVGKRLIVATEHNTVYALRRGSGRVVWRQHLGAPVPQGALPCGNIDPTGITGTPAYDRRTGSIFVVTETTGSHHILRALSWQSGHERWHRDLDVLSGRDRHAEQERGALLVTHGRVYVPFGGRYGDCGNYVGYVAAVPTDGGGRTLHYAVPTARAAGMWVAAGPVEANHSIYVASGNGAETNGRYDGSDSVIRLSYTLHRLGFFAPSTWRQDNAQDLDLGSSSPVPIGDTGRLVIAGKRGDVYDLDGMHGIGGQAWTKSGCAAYGGAADSIHEAPDTFEIVILPCSDGIRALSVTRHRWEWQVPGVAGSPVIVPSRIYSLDIDSGDFVIISTTGHELHRIHVGTVSRFATPVPVGPFVYVGTLNGVVAIRGS